MAPEDGKLVRMFLAHDGFDNSMHLVGIWDLKVIGHDWVIPCKKWVWMPESLAKGLKNLYPEYVVIDDGKEVSGEKETPAQREAIRVRYNDRLRVLQLHQERAKAEIETLETNLRLLGPSSEAKPIC